MVPQSSETGLVGLQADRCWQRRSDRVWFIMAESSWDESVILDQGHLKGYTGGDRELAKQVLQIFAQNAPGYLEALRNDHCDSWRMAAHKLKGAARGIGAWRLARSAERAELMGEPPVAAPARSDALEELDNRLTELLQHIANG